jgi:hypothetical protein
VTDQPQSGPGRSGAGSEPAGDVPAALGPDAPTDVHPAGGPEDEPAPVPPPPPEPPPVPPPPPEPLPVPPLPPEPPPVPLPSPQAVAPAPGWRPEDEPSGPAALAAERPEIAVGAAFAGGLVLALILKRLGR